MDYEEFYHQFQIFEKSLKDKVQNAQKSLKSVTKKSETGDLRGLTKELAQTKAMLADYTKLINDMSELADGLDAKQYMESGEYVEQMVNYCQELEVDVKGDYPLFEIFPFKIKVDSENQDMYIDRKKLHCMRPQSFVDEVKKNRDKLMKASFNASTFVNELAGAYDIAVIKKSSSLNNIKADFNLFLTDLYNYLAPMQRFRREYDIQSYAFDLARVYELQAIQPLVTKDGRYMEFGPNKTAKKLIRILDQNGNEQFLATVRFYKPEGKTAETQDIDSSLQNESSSEFSNEAGQEG